MESHHIGVAFVIIIRFMICLESIIMGLQACFLIVFNMEL